MDTVDVLAADVPAELSYDETPYEHQLPEAGENALAGRIGNTKVYLLSESIAAKRAKVRS